MRCSPRLVLVSLAAFGFLAASCGSDSSESSPSSAAPVSAVAPEPTVTGDITVFAASSLTEAFTELGDQFMKDNPGAKLTFNFAGSGALVTQISQGAPADVFASADNTNMTKLTDAGENKGEPVTIAKNSMEIIVEKGNPKAIKTVADLAAPGLIVVLCADTVPCGKNAATVLSNAAVTLTPASFEDKVKGVVTKVSTGEADAGIVFVTDVNSAGSDAEGVKIPDALNVISDYPIVVTKEAPNATGGQAFVDYVASDAGQTVLATYGFLAP